jgi:putative ABC transport system permease protein
MDALLKDIRYGCRGLLKRPGFTAIAVITLALGIGANSAMFSMVNAVLLRPLSFPESERIVLLEGINPPAGITQSKMSVPDIADWQKQSGAFEQLAGFISSGALLVNGDEPERVRGTGVSAEFFPLFRTNAIKGRTLQADDAQSGREPTVVLSYALWQRRFGADQNVVGSKVMLSRKSTTVVGVMPAGFDYPAQSELWVPFSLEPTKERRDNRFVSVVGRLKPGATTTQAQAELNTINQRLAQAYNETNSGWTVKVTNLRERLVRDVRLSLLVLLCAVAFVLLIACANVANLLLARGSARQKEIAVRTALGASRARVVRQLLTESLLLSVVGGGLGLLLSLWLTKLLIALSPPNSPRFDEIRPDLRVLFFTLGLTLFTGLVFGLAPALQLSRPDLTEGLKDGLRGSVGARRNRVRSALMVAEIALSFMLLVGAGLLIKSFLRLREVSPGFNASNVLTMRVSLPPGKYTIGAPRAQIYRQAIEHLKSLPGVQAAGAVLSLPLGGDTFNVGRAFIREGRPATPEESGGASYLAATPEYFRALQIPVIAGRSFNDEDIETATKVVIVNETLAGRLWPGQSPLGKHLTIWRDENFPREIVGIAGNTKESLDAEATPQMYVPYAQDANWSSLSFVIRTSGDPAAIAAAARSEIRNVDKGIPVFNTRTMDDVLLTSVAPHRTPMLLLSAFASMALLLAMIGIYGVTAYYVTQRTQEIGIRMALGAQMSDVLAMVLKSGMGLAVMGIGAGFAGSLLLTRLMKSLLFGVTATDAATMFAVSLCLLVTALLACYLPARRATKVDPLVALRYE